MIEFIVWWLKDPVTFGGTCWLCGILTGYCIGAPRKSLNRDSERT